MKKILFLFYLLFNSLIVVGSANPDSIFINQISDLHKKIEQIQSDIMFLKTYNDSIFKKVMTKISILDENDKVLSDSIEKQYNKLILYDRQTNKILKKINDFNIFKEKQITKNDILNQKIKSINDSLDFIALNISHIRHNTQNQIKYINFRISRSNLYWLIILFLFVLLVLLLFLFIKKKLSKNNKNLFDQIENTKKYLNNEFIKLDSKLIKILENQIKMPKVERKEEKEIDHSLPIQVGLEIYRMRKRIRYMPEETKGINALKNALERLEDEFNAKGYEIVDLLNKPYNDGLTVEAKFFPSQKLKPGKQIITKVIKPQINYKGRLIYQAKIEVTEGV